MSSIRCSDCGRSLAPEDFSKRQRSPAVPWNAKRCRQCVSAAEAAEQNAATSKPADGEDLHACSSCGKALAASKFSRTQLIQKGDDVRRCIACMVSQNNSSQSQPADSALLPLPVSLLFDHPTARQAFAQLSSSASTAVAPSSPFANRNCDGDTLIVVQIPGIDGLKIHIGDFITVSRFRRIRSRIRVVGVNCRYRITFRGANSVLHAYDRFGSAPDRSACGQGYRHRERYNAASVRTRLQCLK